MFKHSQHNRELKQATFFVKTDVRLPRGGGDWIKGPITWSTFNPRVELSLVNWVGNFCDYMGDFNHGVEMLYVPGIDSRK
jgi:hypothetical protein